MKLVLLINPRAGKDKAKHVAHKACTVLQQRGIQTETCFSEFPGHIRELATHHSAGDFDGIVSVGGDGTLFETINGLAQTDPAFSTPVGIIPVGTGNSFAKDLGIHSFERAVETICQGNTRRVDLGYCKYDGGSYYFINVLGFGFAADVARGAVAYKRLGSLSYVISLFSVIRNLSFYQLQLSIDGKTYERENCFVEICNSTKTGGDMLIAPDARIDDGLLDLIVLNKITRTRLLRAFPKIFKGSHVTLPEVETFKAREINVKSSVPKTCTPDGEVLGQTPLNVEVCPGRISLFA
jgi:diacylglycerol kinase (ATP)